MILYDNSETFAVLTRVSGSVLPSTVPVAVFSFAVGLTLTLLREVTDVMKHAGKYIDNTFAIRTIAVVIGILLAVRTNMALNRWMDGISQIQLMLSKWGDAFIALCSFFAGKENLTDATRERILLFRVRIAHWFCLMSCLAFVTVRERHVSNLEDVPIAEMFGEYQDQGAYRKTQSFCSEKEKEDGQESGSEFEQHASLNLVVLSAPTVNEINHLNVATDKVNCVYYWIILGIVEEIRAGTLDAPPPIVSRVFQEVSNGKLGFNQAHKVAMVPFPFPFAQMVSLLLCLLYLLFPFYIELFTLNKYFSPVLCLFIPVCYCGLNCVAVELEEPFGNDWNDVDLETRQEEFIWMLVDILRQNTLPPANPDHRAEMKILRGVLERNEYGDKPQAMDPAISKYLEKFDNKVADAMG